METPVVKIGVNVFVIKDHKILFGKRIGKGDGTWCLPGGHFEFGESLAGAAARELEEETGLKASNLEFLQLINQPLEDCHYVHINFLAKEWIGEPIVTEPDKFAEWRWFNLSALPEKIFGGHTQFIPAFLQKVHFID
ncbi:MAG: NUDIX domain-containing protein [Candidatus Paceibacterota bacterium]|jgi:8-oxo-dGTP diphosphatase